jgi:hypothetical protein
MLPDVGLSSARYWSYGSVAGCGSLRYWSYGSAAGWGSVRDSGYGVDSAASPPSAGCDAGAGSPPVVAGRPVFRCQEKRILDSGVLGSFGSVMTLLLSAACP